MNVDKLIAELAAGAEPTEARHFTLDREKAREKLREHQLTDPRLYVLELVQAAVIRGATRIRFFMDTDDLRLEFDGEPFDTRDLDELYDAIWSSGGSDRVRARKCLALGFTAVMALQPRFVRLVSSDGEHGATLEVRPDAPDRLEPCRDQPAGTRIHVKGRAWPQGMGDLLRNLSSGPPEKALLRERCRFCDVTVDLAGEVVSKGMALPDAAITVDVTGPGGTRIGGVGGLYPKEARPTFFQQAGGEDRRGYSSRLILVRDGVWITTHPLNLDPGCFVAVVDAPALRKDASQRDFVRDEAYARVLQAVQQAHLAAVADLARARREGRLKGVDPEWFDASLLRVLARHFDRQAYERRDPVMRELALAPALRSVAGARISLQQVIDWWREDGAVLYGSDAFPLLAAGAERSDLERVVQLKTRADESLCEKAFAGALRDADRAFEQRKRRAQERGQDQDRRPPPRLSPGNYLARCELDPARGPQGEVGLLSGPEPESHISLEHEGRTLDDLEPALPLAGIVAVLETAVRVDGDAGGVRRDRRLGRALLAVYDALPELCAALARRQLGEYGSELQARDHRRWLLAEFLALWLDPRGALRFLEACTLPPHIAAAVHAQRPAPPVPPDALASLPPEITRLPLFPTVGGELRSLEQLAARASGAGWLTLVRDEPEGAPPADTLAEALVADATIRDALGRLFGSDALQDVTADCRVGAYRAGRGSRPQRGLAAGGWVGVTFRAPGLEGALGIRPAEGGRHRGTPSQLTVLVEQSVLSQDPLPLPLPAFDAVLRGRGRDAEARSLALADLGRLAPARVALFRAGTTLLWRLLDPEWVDPAADATRDLARRATVALIGDPVLRAVYRLGRRQDPTAAQAHLMDLLDSGVAWPADVLSRALAELVEEGQPCTRDALLGRLPALPVEPDCGPLSLEWDVSSTQPPPAIHWEELSGIQAPAPLLERLARFPCLVAALGDRWLSLTEILAARQEHGRLLAVERHSTARELPTDEPVLALDRLDRQLLQAAIGPGALTDAEPLLGRLAVRASFFAQPPLSHVGLRSSETVAQLRVETACTTGEIGLTRNHYGEAEAELRLCLDRRQAAVRRGFVPLGLVAVLNDDRLTPDPAYDDVENDAVVAHLMGLCFEAVTPLFEQLAAGWAGLGSGDREVAWRHVLDYLVVRHPGADDEPDPVWTRLARLEGFRGLGGRRHSWREVAESARRLGLVEYLPYDMGSASADPGRPIVVASDFEVARLARIHPRVVDFSDAWYEEQEAQTRRRAAPPLPRCPARPLASQRQSLDGGLEIHLWLDPLSADPGREQVAFGREGRVVQERPLSEFYPCLGSIDGPGVEVDRGWTTATLAPEDALQAEEGAVRLYRQLGHRLEHEPEALGDALAATRERLWGLCTRLHRHRADLRPAEQLLLTQLAAQDLVGLRSGERTSLQAALEARPVELTPLGLWEHAPAAPAPDALVGGDIPPAEAALLAALRALVPRLGDDGGAWHEPLSRLVLGMPLHPPDADSPLPIASSQGATLVLHRDHPVVRWAIDHLGQDPLAPALVALRALPALASHLRADEAALHGGLVAWGQALAPLPPGEPERGDATPPSDASVPQSARGAPA